MIYHYSYSLLEYFQYSPHALLRMLDAVCRDSFLVLSPQSQSLRHFKCTSCDAGFAAFCDCALGCRFSLLLARVWLCERTFTFDLLVDSRLSLSLSVSDSGNECVYSV